MNPDRSSSLATDVFSNLPLILLSTEHRVGKMHTQWSTDSAIRHCLAKLEKRPSIEDRGQTDRVTAPTRAGLRRRPRRAMAADDVKMETYHCGRQSVLTGHRSVAHILHPPLILTYDLDFQSPVSYGYDPYTCKNES